MPDPPILEIVQWLSITREYWLVGRLRATTGDIRDPRFKSNAVVMDYSGRRLLLYKNRLYMSTSMRDITVWINQFGWGDRIHRMYNGYQPTDWCKCNERFTELVLMRLGQIWR